MEDRYGDDNDGDDDGDAADAKDDRIAL